MRTVVQKKVEADAAQLPLVIVIVKQKQIGFSFFFILRSDLWIRLCETN